MKSESYHWNNLISLCLFCWGDKEVFFNPLLPIYLFKMPPRIHSTAWNEHKKSGKSNLAAIKLVFVARVFELKN
jgi:hypothetical protein